MKRKILTQMELFSTSTEKGSSEWSAFNAVAGDSSGMFRVATPRPAQPRYGNVVPIRRYRGRGIFPHPAY
jgi:hypothetical protein